jgi:hypothetical protein
MSRDAGVVDQDVDRPDLAVHLADGARARVDVGDVALDREDVVAVLLHVGDPVFVLGVAGRIGDDDLVAGVDHLGGDRLAESTHASSD